MPSAPGHHGMGGFGALAGKPPGKDGCKDKQGAAWPGRALSLVLSLGRAAPLALKKGPRSRVVRLSHNHHLGMASPDPPPPPVRSDSAVAPGCSPARLRSSPKQGRVGQGRHREHPRLSFREQSLDMASALVCTMRGSAQREPACRPTVATDGNGQAVRSSAN